MMKRQLIFYILFFPLLLNAQQIMTLQNAIDTVLKKSFDIQIARNNVEISKLNNNLGMAGGLPEFGIVATDNATLNSSYQKLNTGTESTISDAAGNSLNTGLSASMYLFNGFKITATKQRLDLLQKQSEVQLNLQIQSAVADVMIQYYDIVRQQEYLLIMQNSLDVSNKKLDVITERKNVGMADNVDFLQAQIDVNYADENVKMQQLTIDQGKTDLLNLIASGKYYNFLIDDTIEVSKTLLLDSILICLKNNPNYISAEQSVEINEKLLKETDAQRYPSLKLVTGYNLAHSEYDKGLTLINQIYGPSAGITLQIPIFNWNIYRKQYKAVTYDILNSELEKESILNSLQSSAIKTFMAYSTALLQLETQQENYKLAKELVDLVMKNFQLNQATILEVKDAQSSYEKAAYLLVNLQYTAKIAEIELLSLVYQLKY
jgi:outer membrane protein